jgi:hypothetical protein
VKSGDNTPWFHPCIRTGALLVISATEIVFEGVRRPAGYISQKGVTTASEAGQKQKKEHLVNIGGSKKNGSENCFNTNLMYASKLVEEK